MNQNIQDIIISLQKTIDSTPNYIDLKAMIMAPHVIYQGIEDILLMAELRDAFLSIMMDGEIKGIDYRYLILDYLLDKSYQIDPLLEQYKDNFLMVIQYLISPSSEYEEHIPLYIRKKHEEKAQIFINKHSPLPRLK